MKFKTLLYLPVITSLGLSLFILGYFTASYFTMIVSLISIELVIGIVALCLQGWFQVKYRQLKQQHLKLLVDHHELETEHHELLSNLDVLGEDNDNKALSSKDESDDLHGTLESRKLEILEAQVQELEDELRNQMKHQMEQGEFFRDELRELERRLEQQDQEEIDQEQNSNGLQPKEHLSEEVLEELQETGRHFS